MRQRVMIAMALSCDPELLIADEPTTALDVTIQAQILELIKDLKARMGTSVILITHDLGVVAGMTEKIIVMYAGKVFEQAPTAELFSTSANPYTKGLLKSRSRSGARRGNGSLSNSRTAAGCRASAARLPVRAALLSRRRDLSSRLSAVCANQRKSWSPVPFCKGSLRGIITGESRSAKRLRKTQIALIRSADFLLYNL
jgi:ABC-type dipeptide/oligopeptide/nickel transport system ATPase component